MRRSISPGTMVVLGALTVVGCTSTNQNQPTANGLQGNASPLAASQQLPQPSEDENHRFVSSTFKSISDKISNSLKYEPKVIPADDPVSLAYTPDKVNANIYLQAAALSEEMGNVEGARRQYEAVSNAAPDHVNGLVAYAGFCQRTGDNDQAISLYAKALKITPRNAAVWNAMGLCFARNRDLDRSIKAIGQAVELRPNEPRFRTDLAKVLVDANRVEEAVEQLKVVHPAAVAYYNAGRLLTGVHRSNEAARYFQHALAIDPSMKAASEMVAAISRDRRFAGEQASLRSHPHPQAEGIHAAYIPGDNAANGDFGAQPTGYSQETNGSSATRRPAAQF